MQRINGEELLQQARILHQEKKDYAQAEKLYHEVLNHNPGNALCLFALGTLYKDVKRPGVAVSLLSQAVTANPKLVDAWNNLGLTLRDLGKKEEAVGAIRRALKLAPDNARIWSNLSACYVNMGLPLKALEYAEEALRHDPKDESAKWNKGLALLEMGRFDEAWPLHEMRLTGKLESNVAPRNYARPGFVTPRWDGRTPCFVAIHGEQGLGDEIMFGSCIPDALATGARLLIECTPRLDRLFQRSFPTAIVRGTNMTDGAEWKKRWGEPDAMAGLGSLPKFYRRRLDQFPRQSYLKVDEGRVRAILGRLPTHRPLIGISWQGGVQKTNITERSIPLHTLYPLLREDATWVSLNYADDSPSEVEALFGEMGATVHHLHDIVGTKADYDDTISLVAGLDLLITVSQTCFHAAGAIGVPCWILAPSRPDWRIGVAGDHLPWYGDWLKVYRQIGMDWTPVLERVRGDLRQYLGRWRGEDRVVRLARWRAA